ncbi:MAG TPA: universal stress protein [Beijerinckia sp.]|jgi:nucleotide-binding universal stress UspA family protein|nr:universal stress protein [Beijerinckia sp.]
MFKSILIPIDLNELGVAKPALAAATELAPEDARLRLLTVEAVLPASFMEFVPADFDRKQQERALHMLEEIGTTLSLPKERISQNVRTGVIYREILEEADDWGADLIVIGSHRPAMSTYLLGSNAKTVVRHAKCSVLVIRS